jgi:hypothetical protein
VSAADLNLFGLHLRLTWLNPAGGSQRRNRQIRIECARSETEGIRAGSHFALPQPVERLHSIAKRHAIQRSDTHQHALAHTRLLVGSERSRAIGLFRLHRDRPMLACVITFALVRIVADEKNAAGGFDFGVRILHQHRSLDGRARADENVDGAIFNSHRRLPIPFQNGEGGAGIDFQHDPAGQQQTHATAIGGDAFVVIEQRLQTAAALARCAADRGIAESCRDPADRFVLGRLGVAR